MTKNTTPVSFLHPQQNLLSSQQFSHVIDFLPDAIFVVDVNARLIAWNREMENMTGVKRHEIVGCSREEYTKAIYGQSQFTLLDHLINKLDSLPDRFEQQVNEKDALEAEEWLAHAYDGEGAQLWESASLLFDENGQPAGAIQVCRNITTKKITERSVQQLNRILATIGEISHALVQDSTEEDLLQDIVNIVVNKLRYKMAWIAYLDQLSGQSLKVMVHAGFSENESVHDFCEDRPLGCDPINRALKEKRHYLIKNIFEKRGCENCYGDAQSLGYVSTLALPIIHNEHCIGVLSVYSEKSDDFNNEDIYLLSELADNLAYGITSIRIQKERDKAVDELQDAHAHLEMKVAERTKELSIANEQLKELDKLKSMFIASMSHELRTPLNAIIGFSGVLLKGLSGELNPKQKEHTERIYESGKNLLSLISDVIDIAKLEGDRIDIYPQHVNLKEVIDEVFADNQKQADKKGIYLKSEFEHEVYAYTDRKRLSQSIANLVSNAIKYTEQGGVTVSVKDYYGMLEICVADTGIGIGQEDISKLFEAFERLDSHLKVKAGGSGLGLYLTQKLVTEILAGEVEVESEAGKGSIFKIRISEDLREV